jgi:hypothetical protein
MIRKIGRPCFADKTVLDQTVGAALRFNFNGGGARKYDLTNTLTGIPVQSARCADRHPCIAE